MVIILALWGILTFATGIVVLGLLLIGLSKLFMFIHDTFCK